MQLTAPRIDASGGSREILDRLRNIETLVQKQSECITALSGAQIRSLSDETTSQSQHSPAAVDMQSQMWSSSRPGVSPDLSNLPPLTIPVKHKTSSTYLLTLPSVRALIGDYPTDLFFRFELRSCHSPLFSLETCLLPTASVNIQREIADHLVSAFFSVVHPNHPILDPKDFKNCYERFLEMGPDHSSESTLCMVVLALGAVATATPDLEAFKTSPPGMEYIQHSMPTLISLSAWSLPSSMVVAHALVLASVYFAYIVRPLQSWRLIHSASTVLQINRVGYVF
jgi:hypothetical protein